MPYFCSSRRVLSWCAMLVTTVLCLSARAAEDSNPETSPADSDSLTIQALPLEELRIFAQIYSGVRSSYIREIDDAKLLEYAIKGILSELDPHSSYLDASGYDDLQVQTTGEFGGLGIEVGMKDGYVEVISPIDDTPAERAGVVAGDLIIKLNGDTVKGLTLNEAIEKMRGPKDSDVVLTIVRDGVDAPFELSMKRDVIKVRSVRSGVRDDYYGYIRVAQFQLNTASDVVAAYAKLKKASPDLRGLILDLRNNPGGVLQAAVDLSDAFLEEGLIVYTEGRIAGANKKHFATPGDISDGLPIVVMINDGTASASEIVAGALQDNQRAVIIGTRSFGKGSVQSVIPISEDRAVKLTTALYFTPSGRSIQAQGIAPDLEVERVRVTAVQPRAYITEADLDGHLGNANGGEEMAARNRPEAELGLQNSDSQLYEALNLLKGISVFQGRQHGSKQATTHIETEAGPG